MNTCLHEYDDFSGNPIPELLSHTFFVLSSIRLLVQEVKRDTRR